MPEVKARGSDGTDSGRRPEGNKIQDAQALGMSRATIYRRIREYGIVMPQPG